MASIAGKLFFHGVQCFLFEGYLSILTMRGVPQYWSFIVPHICFALHFTALDFSLIRKVSKIIFGIGTFSTECCNFISSFPHWMLLMHPWSLTNTLPQSNVDDSTTYWCCSDLSIVAKWRVVWIWSYHCHGLSGWPCASCFLSLSFLSQLYYGNKNTSTLQGFCKDDSKIKLMRCFEHCKVLCIC